MTLHETIDQMLQESVVGSTDEGLALIKNEIVQYIQQHDGIPEPRVTVWRNWERPTEYSFRYTRGRGCAKSHGTYTIDSRYWEK